MLPPLVILVLAALSAAAMAYGTDPRWANTALGVDMIMHARRLQWPLACASLGLCVGLIAMVISGRRRAWWLVGLLPVLVLFMHRFSLASVNRLAVWDQPLFVLPENAGFLDGDDYVVGLVFGDQAYAYPYAALYRTPLIVQTDRDKRLVLMWSAQANRAVARRVSREIVARDLEVVASPAGALLVYNRRLGQFINGLSGLTPDGQAPAGFDATVPAQRTTWRTWRARHPQTQVMMPLDGRASRPNAPLGPPPLATAEPGASGGPDERGLHDPAMPILFICTQPPVAVRTEDLSSLPLHVMAGDVPVLVVRDEQGAIRAFDRRIESDLLPRFEPCRESDRSGAALVDRDTGTGWSLDGVAVDGERRGQKLIPIEAEPELYWGVMKHWYPALKLHRPEPDQRQARGG